MLLKTFQHMVMGSSPGELTALPGRHPYPELMLRYASLQGHPRHPLAPQWRARIGLALVLLVGLAGMLLYLLGQEEVVPWLHMVLHAVGLSHGGPLRAHLR
jgi:hypothetical protein